ncbi:hypothetical protein [Devosia sp.]|uniref:hypothetical protein n=1 Tax=Devosia sp. TaxID=1871048 RepID=UPI0032664363
MKIFGLLRGAVLGWIDIVAGRAGWRDRFSFTGAGLIMALVVFALVALIVTLFETTGESISGFGIGAALVVEMMAVLAIVVASFAVKIVTRSAGPVRELIVPGIYALVPYVLVRAIMVAFAAPLVTLVLLGLAFLMFRLGRMAGPWRWPAALAFAVLMIVLLVGMPLTLYIVGNPANSPI